MEVFNSTPLTRPVLLAGVLATLVLLIIYSRRYRPPPGPPGNVAAEFTKAPMPILFDKWRKQYGTPQTSCSKLDLILLRSDILFQGWEKTRYRYAYRAPVLPDTSLKTPQS
jgi:hypothetical protein